MIYDTPPDSAKPFSVQLTTLITTLVQQVQNKMEPYFGIL